MKKPVILSFILLINTLIAQDNITNEHYNSNETFEHYNSNGTFNNYELDNTINTEQEFNLTYEMEKAFNNSNGRYSNYTDLPPSSPIDSISQDEIEHNNTADYKDRLQWEEQVSNFSFSNFVTLRIESGEGETLYEEITEPTIMRFAFMVNHPTKKIDFSFIGPTKDGMNGTIAKAKEKNYFFFEFNAEIPGLYTFYINNKKYKSKAKVTFAFNAYKAEDKIIDSDKLDNLSQRLNNIDSKMGDLRLKANMVVKKVEGHNRSVVKHNRTIVIFTIIEVATMILIFIFQSVYISKLFIKV